MATSPFGFSGTGKQAAPPRPRPRPQYNPTPGPQGTGTYPVTHVNSQNDALRRQVEGYEQQAANRPEAGQNVTLAALGPPKPLDPSRSLAPADMQPRNVSPVNYQDRARTQFGAHLPGYDPIPGMSRPAAASASVGPATQEKVDRIFGAGKKIVVDGQIRNAPGTERKGPGRLSDGSIAWSPVSTRHNKNLSSKEQAEVDAAQAAAAERFGTETAPGPNQLAKIARDKRAATPQGQAVAANAANRGQQRRERIAMRKNPAVARNIFFADQERQMQGLRNQGAIGVAEQNARGDISRIGGQEAIQRERLAIARAQAGLPAESGGPDTFGPAGAPLPGMGQQPQPGNPGNPGNGTPVTPQLPQSVNAEVRAAAATGDTEKAEEILRANGVTDNDMINSVMRSLTGDGGYGLGFWERPIGPRLPGAPAITPGGVVRSTLMPFTSPTGSSNHTKSGKDALGLPIPAPGDKKKTKTGGWAFGLLGPGT